MLNNVDLLLQQIRLLDPLTQTDQRADVLILEGKIQEISPHLTQIPDNLTKVAADHLILAPGLVDLYSHSGEPGYEERETLQTLTESAIAGGFSRLSILPTTTPSIDNATTLNGLKQRVQSLCQGSSLQVQFWGSLTLNAKGQQMAELKELIASGVIGFTDNAPIPHFGLLRRLLEYLNPFRIPIALVPLNRELQGNGVIREGKESILYGLTGNPAISETSALTAILEVVEATQTPVHLMRISTRRGVELIAEAKAKGLPITASVAWMHLLLNTLDIASYNPNLRLEPPLGNPSDQEALREGVKKGIIDAIAVDHTPYTYEEKTVSFAEAPAGAIGLELILPLLWENLVIKGDWSPLTLWQALSLNPSRCLYQDPPTCQVGQSEDYILFAPHCQWQVEGMSLHSLAMNTPWWEKTLTGKVISPQQLKLKQG